MRVLAEQQPEAGVGKSKLTGLLVNDGCALANKAMRRNAEDEGSWMLK